MARRVEPGDDDGAYPENARLGAILIGVALVVSVIGSLGAPLITSVATGMDVSLDAAQWTLTVSLFTGAIAAPVLGRLGTGPLRRRTILIALGLVALGGVFTVLPLPFWGLILGRALQGFAFGISPLLMSVARDHLPIVRSAPLIGALAVTTTVGIGVGYPLMGLLDQVGGLRLAYGAGFALSVAAVVLAWRALPVDPPRTPVHIDIPGAILLAAGTFALLVAIAETDAWTEPWIGLSLVAAAGACLAGFTVVELRVASPLVDLRLFARAGVLRANVAMFLSGIGLYLLFVMLSRYLQTPAEAGYGFGLSSLAAGAALIPFSALGFLAGRLLRRMLRRVSAPTAYLVPTAGVIACAVIVVLGSGSLIAILVAMACLGFGLGGITFLMPVLLLTEVPARETSSALAINQIVRTVGFSLGSALTGLLLAQATPAGVLSPAPAGYTTAALWAIPFLVLSALLVLPVRRPSR